VAGVGAILARAAAGGRLTLRSASKRRLAATKPSVSVDSPPVASFWRQWRSCSSGGWCRYGRSVWKPRAWPVLATESGCALESTRKSDP